MARKLPTYLEFEEFKKLMNHTKRIDHKVGFLLGFGAGMRLSEIVGSCKRKSNCCKADIIKEKVKNNGNNKIQVITCSKCFKKLILTKDTYLSDEVDIKPITNDQFDLKGKRIHIEGGKGGVDRVVPIPKGFKEYMLKELPLNKRYKTINSARRSFQRMFKQVARKSKLLKQKPNLHFHSLRHSFGSRMANKGVPIHHIRTLMGHTNISTTNIYLISNPEKALDDYERLF